MVDLSTLTVEQLRALQAQAQAAIELKERKPGRSNHLQVWYDALATVMDQWHEVALPHYVVWQRSKAAATMAPKLDSAEAFARKLFSKPPRRNDMIGAREFVVWAVLNYVTTTLKLGPTPGAVCSNMGNVSAAVETEFPGYRASGMLPLAFQMWIAASARGDLTT